MNPSGVEKILVRAPNWIGDAVMATPALRALRHFYKTAEIVLLAKPAVASLFERHPDIDRVIVYDDPGAHTGVRGFLRLAALLRGEGFDLAFLLQNALEAALLAFFACIPRRVGYSTDGRGLFLTRRMKKAAAPVHRSDAYLALMRLVDGIEEKSAAALALNASECEAARDFLKSLGVSFSGPVIGLNAGAAYGTAKRWPPERFALLADRLADQFQAQILIFGGKTEVETAEQIKGRMRNSPVLLSGKTTVRQMMACIKQCQLFISNDSGPMHVASALCVPQVAIFGPTNPAATFSQGAQDIMVQNKVECSPCRHRVCPIDHRCMERLSVDVVFGAAVTQLTRLQKKTGAVFIDRDGTLNPDPGYINKIEGFSLFPSAAAAIARLNQREIPVILVTNQSGVARRIFPESFVAVLHLHLQRLLAREGAYLDGIYYCPHHPDGPACGCRKPAGGMIRQAMRDHALDFSLSYVVGDKASDIGLAESLSPEESARSVLVRTGEGDAALKALSAAGKRPAYVAEDLSGAVDWILEETTRRNN